MTAAIAPASVDVARTAAGRRWIHGPARDVALMLAWVPFAVAALAAGSDRHALGVVVAVTLLISLAHQPLTLGLIYGDPAQFAVARRVFTVAPFVLLVGVLAGQAISLALVGVVAGLWNAEHTLMQRYGVVRIYGRKAGEGTRAYERPMLISWLVLALVWAAADARTPALLRRVDLGATNEAGVRVLHSLQPGARVAAMVAVLAVIVTVTRWWCAERTLAVTSAPKRLYLLTTALLFGVMLWNPIVGLVGYVGAHAVEYVVIVHSALGSRYGVGRSGDGRSGDGRSGDGRSGEGRTGNGRMRNDPDSGGVVGRAVRSPLRATGCVLAYLAIVGGALFAVQTFVAPTVASVVLLTVGGMHVLFDGFIWKLRRPVVARSLRA